MIKSMTGFGSAKGYSGKLEISVEIKSVNNRHLDCSVRIPRAFMSIEEKLKSIASSGISRGKVDIFVYIDSSNADDIEVRANHSLAKEYIAALREIASENGISGEMHISDLTRFPDILQTVRREVDAEQLGDDISKILQDAMAGFNEMRLTEGEKLWRDMSARLEQIERLTMMAESLSPETVEEYRKKLEVRMSEILQSTSIDDARILTEAAIFADRTAINEEVVRLHSHISQLRSLIGQSEPVGRKLDFLIQEMNREANTIGSKGSDARMAKITVDLKAEIEKIREQAQNVE